MVLIEIWDCPGRTGSCFLLFFRGLNFFFLTLQDFRWQVVFLKLSPSLSKGSVLWAAPLFLHCSSSKPRSCYWSSCSQLRLRWVCWILSPLRWCFQRNIHITATHGLDALCWRFLNRHKECCDTCKPWPACTFCEEHPGFLPLARWLLLTFCDDIPLVSLVCVSLPHALL